MITQAIGLAGILQNGSALNGIQGVSGLTQLTQGQNTARNGDTDGAGDTGNISAAGQLLNKLETLKQQNPAKFTQLLTQVAGELTTAAQQQGQGPQSQFLTQLANQFTNAAQTGDLTQLQPHHGGHHRHPAQAAYAQNQPGVQDGALAALQTSGQNAALSPDNQGLLASIFQQLNSATAAP